MNWATARFGVTPLFALGIFRRHAVVAFAGAMTGARMLGALLDIDGWAANMAWRKFRRFRLCREEQEREQ